MKTEWKKNSWSVALSVLSPLPAGAVKMDADTCLTYSAQSRRRTPEHSPRLEQGSFLPFDGSQKVAHLPPPHRLALRADAYAAAMARFGDAAAEFTHGGVPLNPPASPPKQKFLESQDQKGSTVSGKPAFYDDNTEGEKLVLTGLERHTVCLVLPLKFSFICVDDGKR